ncbi:MAG: transcriptional repressor [Candidatus Aminicenantes bacterium]|nr:transcriptional repressor [Candidatus Aminicenantes bacterium]
MDKKKIVFRRLKDEGFKITPQRAAIIDFLLDNGNHPSAEEIYKGIKTEYPMVSFSTVYNTLRVLERIGFIKSLNITENRVNFDPETYPHHHLYCERCGRIVDVQLDADISLLKNNTVKVNSYRIYLYGICLDCLRKEREKTV